MKTCLVRYLFIVFVLLSFVEIGRAQENPLHLPCQHREFKVLDFLAGEWEVSSRFRLADGRWEETKARSLIKAELSGCSFREELVGLRDGRVFRAYALFSFNSIAQKLQRSWIDSEHGLQVLYEGSKTDQKIVFESELRIGERVIKFQHYYEIEADSFRFESRRSRDGGKTWDTGWFMMYKKVGP